MSRIVLCFYIDFYHVASEAKSVQTTIVFCARGTLMVYLCTFAQYEIQFDLELPVMSIDEFGK